MNLHREPIPVGPVSEAMFSLESPDCPRSGFVFMTFCGDLDLQAMKQAVTKTQLAFLPTICRLEERKEGLFYNLYRVPINDPAGLVVVDDFRQNPKDRTPEQSITDYFQQKTREKLDLFTHQHAIFYLFSFPQNLYVLAIYTHHIVSDGATNIGTLQSVFARYHEAVTGRAPTWDNATPIPSSGGRQLAKHSYFKVYSGFISESLRRNKHPLIRLGEYRHFTSSKRHVAKITLSEERTRQVVKRARTIGTTVNDLLSLSVIRAIDEVLGMPEGTLSLWIPVNVRSIVKSLKYMSNVTTSINIDLIKSERRDPRRMMERFVSQRKHLLDVGRDYVFLRTLEKLLALSHLMPVRMRKPRLKKLFSQPMTIGVSNMGILWPKIVDGKLTPYTFLENPGGLDILGYDLNFSVDDAVGHGMVAYTFNGRLHVRFSVLNQCMEPEQADSFAALVENHLVDG